jgi:REP-associated tyrosine transposase
MPYWQLFYHVVWATKNRQPLVMPEVESEIYGYLRGKAIGLDGTVFALNGTVDHVHLVVSIPPKMAVATFIGQVKGVASTRFNKAGVREPPLFWQGEYGVFSFDSKRLSNFVGYVEEQKAHHSQAKTIPILERMDDQGVKMVREVRSHYGTSDNDWWQEMMALDGS